MSENPKTTEHMHPITICLDFDGVCNTYDGWKGKGELFKPLPGLEGFLVALKERGYQIFVFSTRGPEKLSQWFHLYGLNHLIDGYPIQKPPAVMYVDDRGFNFAGDFDEVLEEIDTHGTEPWWHEDCSTDRFIPSVVARVAQIAHEVNRAYCQSQEDYSQVHWAGSPQWQRDSCMNGVEHALANPTMTPAGSHENWLAEKVKDGWVFGPVKDPERKTHPCMLPYGELPPEQRVKDALFLAVVRGASA